MTTDLRVTGLIFVGQTSGVNDMVPTNQDMLNPWFGFRLR
jgi:hypothetical protein